MGAGFSSWAEEDGGDNLQPGLGDVPESCVASVLLNMNPQEICKLARLNRTFRGAASADFVWETKLPSNYVYLLEKLFSEVRVNNLTKKEIYAQLCRPKLFDGGTKEVWLEKTTGAIYLSISSKAMSITGIDDRRYWNYIPTDESRFHVVAYLRQIWWFEVDGEIEFSFPPGVYSLFFRLQLGRPTKRLGRRSFNFDHIHGWDIKPVHFQLSTSDGQHAVRQCYLEEPENCDAHEGSIKNTRGIWINYHVGDFVVENSGASTKVKFSMIQIDCTHTKGGVCVDSVLIYPSKRERRKGSSRRK